MALKKDWTVAFQEGKELVLATCSKSGSPNANVVVSLGFVDGKLLIADCSMDATLKNLKETRRVCAVSGYYRLKGSVEIKSSGKYFNLCTKKSKGYTVKNAVLIKPEEVLNLDNKLLVLK